MRVGSPWVGTPAPTQTKATVTPELTGLIASFVNPTTTSVRWSPVTNATHYEWRRNGGGWNETTETAVRDTVPTATTLTYDVRVSQPFVGDIETVKLTPAPITDLVALYLDRTSGDKKVGRIQIPVASRPVGATHIQYRENGGSWSEIRIEVGSFFIGGNPGQTIKVEVRVSQPYISTIYSESFTLATDSVPVPIAPSGTITLSFEVVGDIHFRLSWNHPSVRGVPTATYSLYQNISGVLRLHRSGLTITNINLTTSGGRYFIRAINPSGHVDSNTVVLPD